MVFAIQRVSKHEGFTFVNLPDEITHTHKVCLRQQRDLSGGPSETVKIRDSVQSSEVSCSLHYCKA